MRQVTGWIALLLAAGPALGGETPKAPAQPTLQVNTEEIAWKAGPPSLQPGAKSAVLEGDPGAEGIFTMRIELPAKFRVAPHTHPGVERVTVLRGSVMVQVGEKAAKKVTAGGFYLTAPGEKHTIWTDEGVLLQLTGNGPWGIAYVDPADDPRAAKK